MSMASAAQWPSVYCCAKRLSGAPVDLDRMGRAGDMFFALGCYPLLSHANLENLNQLPSWEGAMRQNFVGACWSDPKTVGGPHTRQAPEYKRLRRAAGGV
jgi:hypothetical protein